MQKKRRVSQAKRNTGRRRVTLGKAEKQRLIQLAVCFAVFLVVAAGKGKIPEELQFCIQSNTDFKGVFSSFIETLSNGGSVAVALDDLATALVGINKNEITKDVPLSNIYTEQLTFSPLSTLSTKPPTMDSMIKILGLDVSNENLSKQPVSSEVVQTPDKANVQEDSDLTPPEGASMQFETLHIDSYITPVFGELTSTYGYRDHPITGELTFHTGVDIAADIGTPIAAFASGVVEYIGESDEYGQYIQVDHGNGTKTFYCHCDELYLPKGTIVTSGQTIASVGKTGNATGSHLHFEIKQNGVLLNPQYYIEQ